MKWSHYNIIYNNNDGNFILYNTKTDKIIALTQESKEILEKNISFIKNLKTIYPSLFLLLVNQQFLVQNHRREVKEILHDLSLIKKDICNYRITINPTLMCNMSCWYCYENKHDAGIMSFHTLTILQKHIAKTIKKKELKSFLLSFFGGEPLLAYDQIVWPLISFAKERCLENDVDFRVHITTNGYLLSNQKIEQLKAVHKISFQITLDGDREHHNAVKFLNSGKNTYNMIISNIKLLLKSHIYVYVRLNYTNNNYSSFVNILDDFFDIEILNRKYLSFSFHKVWQEKFYEESIKISRIIQVFENKGYNVAINPHANKNVCYADKYNNIVVNYNGDIFSCTARNFSKETREGVLLNDGSLRLNSKYSDRKKNIYNSVCKKCILFPICLGGCSQDRIEQTNLKACLRKSVFELKDYLLKERINRITRK
jgi:uncharacterized protein